MDGQEVRAFKTDPHDADTDGDGLGDAVENPLGTPYPGVDTDSDGLIDALDLDSDNDGIDDSEEIVAGSDGYITNRLSATRTATYFVDNAEIQIYGTDPTDAADPGDTDGISSWHGAHDVRDELRSSTTPTVTGWWRDCRRAAATTTWT